MSSLSAPFITLAVDGRISPAQIDDFVDRWHEEHSGRHLHEYLGLTSAEYALWLVEPQSLDAIVKARSEGIPLSELVSTMIAHGDGASTDVARNARLERWLVEQSTRG